MEAALDGVVFQQVGEVVRGHDIADGDDLHILAHEPLLNFDVMKRTLEVYLDSKETPSVALPQYNFAYKVGTGISTVCHFKAFMFKPEELKGQLVGRTLFPYGYQV